MESGRARTPVWSRARNLLCSSSIPAAERFGGGKKSEPFSFFTVFVVGYSVNPLQPERSSRTLIRPPSRCGLSFPGLEPSRGFLLIRRTAWVVRRSGLWVSTHVRAAAVWLGTPPRGACSLGLSRRPWFCFTQVKKTSQQKVFI